jgi:hypothetical protein
MTYQMNEFDLDGFGYTDASGCHYMSQRHAVWVHGGDLPEQMEFEAQHNFEEDCIATQDAIEISGPSFQVTWPIDDIPF